MANKISDKAREEFLDALWDHIKPDVENETSRKLQAATKHILTCGDLSHGHGIMRLSWEPPQEVEE